MLNYKKRLGKLAFDHWINCSFQTNFSTNQAPSGRDTKLQQFKKLGSLWNYWPIKTEKLYGGNNLFTSQLDKYFKQFEQEWQKRQKSIHSIHKTAQLPKNKFFLLSTMLAINYVRNPKYFSKLLDRKKLNDIQRILQGLAPIPEPHGEPILAVINFFNSIMQIGFENTHTFYLKVFDTKMLEDNKVWIAANDFSVKLINYLSYSHNNTDTLICHDKINFDKPYNADLFTTTDLILL